MKQEFISELKNLKNLLEEKPRELRKPAKIHDYGYGKIDFRKKNINISIKKIIDMSFDLALLYRQDKTNKQTLLKILNITSNGIAGNTKDLINLAKTLKEKSKTSLNITIPKNIPVEIKQNMASDLRELEKAYNSQCYRAATILCGRVLETALHRKYYEATGNDILEKNPGIGLGKLIAKMAQKNIAFDPGLTQQIHLINQVRIHSVHVKKQSFYPSAQQTYAMILYSMDVLGKMF